MPLLILYDGPCGLCQRAVRFIIRRDPEALFQFAPLNSPAAQGRLQEAGWSGPLPDSLVLIDGQDVYFRSRAARKIAAHLTAPWRSLAWAAGMIPPRWADGLYDLLARHRTRFFGRTEACVLPQKNEQDRFLPDS